MFGTSWGGDYGNGGQARVVRQSGSLQLRLDDGSVEFVTMQGVPRDFLPEGATLYIELVVRQRESDGRLSEQLAVFDLDENGAKGPLRGAVWTSLDEPEIEGVTFSAKPK